MDDVMAWERQEGETPVAWAAFQIYRDLGSQRSLVAAREVLNRPVGYRRRLEEWSAKHEWVRRTREYDNHLDRIARVQREQTKQDDYALKVESYRDETERTGRAMISMGARAIAILQRELNSRLQTPEVLKAREIANLMRASVTAVDIGSRLVADALGVYNAVDLLTRL